VKARWIIGADGGNSRVRRWCGLDAFRKRDFRYAFRQHYRVAPWTDRMELYWGRHSQIYVTPVAEDEVCLALISRDPKLRLTEALQKFPELKCRLGGADVSSAERGALTATLKLKRVSRRNAALIGDASGTVDAITGEGLCLAFSQAMVLAAEMPPDIVHLHSHFLHTPASVARYSVCVQSSKYVIPTQPMAHRACQPIPSRDTLPPVTAAQHSPGTRLASAFYRSSSVRGRDHIGGNAVLGYGPTEILPPICAISTRPGSLCRPHAGFGPHDGAESRLFARDGKLLTRDGLSAGGNRIRTLGPAR